MTKQTPWSIKYLNWWLRGFGLSYPQYIRVFGKLQQLAGFAQTDAMQRGKIVTAREDAHVAELFLSENIPQGSAAAEVALVYLQAIALLVHL